MSKNRTARRSRATEPKASVPAQFVFSRGTRIAFGRSRKYWILIPGTKILIAALLITMGSAVRVFAGHLGQQTKTSGPSPALRATSPVGRGELEAMAAQADGDYDLRDANNRPIHSGKKQEELKRAEVRQKFEAMFSVSLPRQAQVLDLLSRFRQLFLGLAAKAFPLFGFFDGLTPPVPQQPRPIAAGAFSSFAPVLFAAVIYCRCRTSDRTGVIPLVLRC